jgi:hypothetical protein
MAIYDELAEIALERASRDLRIAQDELNAAYAAGD